MTREDNGTFVRLSVGDYVKIACLVGASMAGMMGAVWKFSLTVTSQQATMAAEIGGIKDRLSRIEERGRGGEGERGR